MHGVSAGEPGGKSGSDRGRPRREDTDPRRGSGDSAGGKRRGNASDSSDTRQGINVRESGMVFGRALNRAGSE